MPPPQSRHHPSLNAAIQARLNWRRERAQQQAERRRAAREREREEEAHEREEALVIAGKFAAWLAEVEDVAIDPEAVLVMAAPGATWRFGFHDSVSGGEAVFSLPLRAQGAGLTPARLGPHRWAALLPTQRAEFGLLVDAVIWLRGLEETAEG
jgi:hypothetical protein